MGRGYMKLSNLVDPQKATYLIYKLYWEPGKRASITNPKSGIYTDAMRSELKVIYATLLSYL